MKMKMVTMMKARTKISNSLSGFSSDCFLPFDLFHRPLLSVNVSFVFSGISFFYLSLSLRE